MLKKFFEKKVINKYVTEISTFCIVGKYPQKIIFEKIKKGIQKRRISCWFQKCWKIFTDMYQKKVINQNVSEIFHFSTFTENPKTLFAYNF